MNVHNYKSIRVLSKVTMRKIALIALVLVKNYSCKTYYPSPEEIFDVFCFLAIALRPLKCKMFIKTSFKSQQEL